MESKESKSIIDKILSILKPNLRKRSPSKDEDILIELLIGTLFSLEKHDYEVIFNTINESEELLPIRELKRLKLEDILEKMSG